MANYGDNYSYQIQIGANGIQDAKAASAAVRDLGESADMAGRRAANSAIAFAQMQASLDEIALHSRMTSAALNDVTMSVGTRLPAGAKRAGDGMGNLSNILFIGAGAMEDAQFGARALGNNLVQLAAMATMRAHPAIAAVATIGTVVATVFGKDMINSALAYVGILDENLIPKTKEQTAVLESMATAAGRVADRLKADSAEVQKAGRDIAQGMDDMSSQGKGDLIQRLIPDKIPENRMRVLKDLKDQLEGTLAGMPTTGFLDFGEHSRKAVEKRLADTLEAMRKVRVDAEQAATAQITGLQAEAARGSETAKQKLIEMAKAVGTQEMLAYADAVFKTTRAYKEWAAQGEKNKQVLEDQGKAQDELMKKGAAAAEEQAQRLLEAWEKEKKIQAERDEAAAKRFGGKADVQANAFRGALSPQIQAMLADAAGRGMDPGAARAAVMGQASQAMQRSGVNPMEASAAAAKLVEEQSAFVEQMVANLDAVLGMLVGQERVGTWGRKQAAIQANQLRAMQLRMPQDPWRNNRGGVW